MEDETAAASAYCAIDVVVSTLLEVTDVERTLFVVILLLLTLLVFVVPMLLMLLCVAV